MPKIDWHFGGAEAGTSWVAVEQRIIHSRFYQSQCSRVEWSNFEELVNANVGYIGGCRPDPPAPFLCLLIRLKQLRPGRDQLREFLSPTASAYVRVLVATLVRMTIRQGPLVYELLDPLLSDYRIVRVRDTNGEMHNWSVDEFVDQLVMLNAKRPSTCCDGIINGVPLPYLAPRWELERRGLLGIRNYALDDRYCDEQHPLHTT